MLNIIGLFVGFVFFSLALGKWIDNLLRSVKDE
jgi:hypothetical protein